MPGPEALQQRESIYLHFNLGSDREAYRKLLEQFVLSREVACQMVPANSLTNSARLYGPLVWNGRRAFTGKPLSIPTI